MVSVRAPWLHSVTTTSTGSTHSSVWAHVKPLVQASSRWDHENARLLLQSAFAPINWPMRIRATYYADTCSRTPTCRSIRRITWGAVPIPIDYATLVSLLR